MTSTIVRLKAARRAGVPIVLVTTADPSGFAVQCREGFQSNGTTPPIVSWDCARGLTPVNQPGASLLADVAPAPDPGSFAPPPGGAYVDAVALLGASCAPVVLLVHQADRLLADGAAVQVTATARDAWKANGAMIVLLSPGGPLPVELSADALTLDEPLPTPDAIGAILDREHTAASDVPALGIAPMDADTRAAAVAALQGLPAFACEQAIALGLIEQAAVSPSDLWARKGAAIGAVPGLSLDTPTVTLEDLGGLASVREFGRRLFAGDDAPSVVVRIDEIEKAMAGFGSDTSGVTTDQVGVLLSAMEDEGWTGQICAGPPGSGKSMFSKALAASYGRRTLTLDLGAAKGSLVGQSERQIRAMLKTVRAVAGRGAYFVATCNKLQVLPPELRRRFTCGIWYFDLPDATERDAIWGLQLRAAGLPLDSARPVDDGWTGAEIRNACTLARRLRIAPADAASYIVPVSQSDPDSIATLRRSAAGRWLSASYPGAYRLPGVQTAPPTGARQYGGL